MVHFAKYVIVLLAYSDKWICQIMFGQRNRVNQNKSCDRHFVGEQIVIFPRKWNFDEKLKHRCNRLTNARVGSRPDRESCGTRAQTRPAACFSPGRKTGGLRARSRRVSQAGAQEKSACFRFPWPSSIPEIEGNEVFVGRENSRHRENEFPSWLGGHAIERRLSGRALPTGWIEQKGRSSIVGIGHLASTGWILITVMEPLWLWNAAISLVYWILI